jgi:hypothetical protein
MLSSLLYLEYERRADLARTDIDASEGFHNLLRRICHLTPRDLD